MVVCAENKGGTFSALVRLLEPLVREIYKPEHSQSIPIVLEQAPNPAVGDFRLSCESLAESLQTSAQEVVSLLGDMILTLTEVVEVKRISPNIYFRVSDEFLHSTVIAHILAAGGAYGNSSRLQGKTIVVGYSSPNANKPLHVGHIRNITIGASLSNLFEAAGARVIRDCLVSDIGIHICKALLAYELWGRGLKPESKSEKGDHFVGRYYRLFGEESGRERGVDFTRDEWEQREKSEGIPLLQEVRDLFEKWRNDDPSTRKLWGELIQWVYKGFDETYENLDVRFDLLVCESELYGLAGELIEMGLREGVFTAKNDRTIVYVDGEKDGFAEKLLTRSDGSPLSITIQMAGTVSLFQDRSIDSLVAILGDEWKDAVRLHDKILADLGYVGYAGKCHPVFHGMVYHKRSKMKSRDGEVITADELISEIQQRIFQELQNGNRLKEREVNLERARTRSDIMIKYYFLSKNVKENITYEPDRITSHAENKGALVHRVREQLIGELTEDDPVDMDEVDFSLLRSREERAVASHLLVFPATVDEAVRRREPATIARYVCRLVELFTKLGLPYAQSAQVSEGQKAARQSLAKATLVVLGKGLHLLNVRGALA